MPIQITITITDLDRLSREIDDIGDSLIESFDWASLAPMIAEGAERVFNSEGHGTWAALSPAYARWKSVNFPGRRILELTGTYKEAATRPGAPYNFVETGNDHIRFGVRGLDYPQYHEQGTSRLPARPVFDLLADDEGLAESVADRIAEHIQSELRRLR